MDIRDLEEAVASSSAMRRILRLLPVGGDGSYVAPPTYLGDQNSAVHVFEVRRIGGKDVQCVLLDSVQSQANRLEDALEHADDIGMPNVYVDFTGESDLKDLGTVSSLQAPHRIFDAIIRDSSLDGVPFLSSSIGEQVNSATPQNATALFAHSPSTLVFGGWNSTGDKGGSGRRFQRCIVSEIVGVNVPVHTYTNRNQEQVVVPQGKKPASRIDPLAIEKVDIYKPKARRSEWQTGEFEGFQKAKPADVIHGNIPPTISDHGVTMDYAMQTTTITLAGLRRLSFPDSSGRRDEGRNVAARTVLASLALCAITKHDADGYSLRSRCDLYPESRSDEFEIIRNDGRIDRVSVTASDAVSVFAAAVEKAKSAGLPWDPEPRALAPQHKLVDLVRKSRNKKMQEV